MPEIEIFTDEALSAFFTEVKSIINSRAACDYINDLESITPCHILIGQSNPNYNSCVFQEQDISLTTKWKAVQTATNTFRKEWLKAYLPTLTERKRWQLEKRNCEIGDLVFILDKNMHRSY